MHRRRRREEEPLWLRLAPFWPLMSWSGRPDKDTGRLKQLWRVLLFTPIFAWSLIVVADSRIVILDTIPDGIGGSPFFNVTPLQDRQVARGGCRRYSDS